LIPKYAQVRIRSHNKTITRQTETQAAKLRIKNEIKFLYSKKQHLNKTLYKLHLENAKQWRQLWNTIHNNITEKAEMRMRIKYTNLNNKIHKLEHNNTGNKARQEHNDTFQERMINLTNTTFTDEELQLLNKGLKYNLHYKRKNWIEPLAIEADTAINKIDPKEQEYMRQIVANNIKKLINKYKTLNDRRITLKHKRDIRERKLIYNIKEKIKSNLLVIVKADKGNTLVILQEDDYNHKVKEFITQNKYIKIPHGITNTQ
jgi:hypothetical protein